MDDLQNIHKFSVKDFNTHEEDEMCPPPSIKLFSFKNFKENISISPLLLYNKLKTEDILYLNRYNIISNNNYFNDYYWNDHKKLINSMMLTSNYLTLTSTERRDSLINILNKRNEYYKVNKNKIKTIQGINTILQTSFIGLLSYNFIANYNNKQYKIFKGIAQSEKIDILNREAMNKILNNSAKNRYTFIYLLNRNLSILSNKKIISLGILSYIIAPYISNYYIKKQSILYSIGVDKNKKESTESLDDKIESLEELIDYYSYIDKFNYKTGTEIDKYLKIKFDTFIPKIIFKINRLLDLIKINDLNLIYKIHCDYLIKKHGR